MPQEDDPIFDPWNLSENPPGSRGSNGSNNNRPEGPKLTRRKFLEQLFILGGTSYIVGFNLWSLYGLDKPFSEVFTNRTHELVSAEKEQLFDSLKLFLSQNIDLETQPQLQQILNTTQANSPSFKTAKLEKVLISMLNFTATDSEAKTGKSDMYYLQGTDTEESKAFKFLLFHTNKDGSIVRHDQTSALPSDQTPQIMEKLLHPFVRPSSRGIPWTDTTPDYVPNTQGPPPGTKFATFNGEKTTLSLGISPSGETFLTEIKPKF